MSGRSNSDSEEAPLFGASPSYRRNQHMPCGPRARLTAYVAYQNLAFAERDVLLAALADAGFA